jgi:hypothetical protein
MTGTTPVYGIPYLQDGDPLSDLPESLEDLAEAVESSLTGFGGIASPGSWTTPTLAVGSDFGSGASPIRYRKIGSEVILRGLLGGLGGGLSSGTTVLTVPSGFRPTAGYVSFVVVASTGTARVDVQTSGAVVCQTTLAAGGFLGLNGVRFFID